MKAHRPLLARAPSADSEARLSRRVLLGGGAGLALAACLPTWAAPGPSTGCAAAGPRRVIAAGGALTEIVYALGAQECLVANDLTSQYPPSAARLPKIGYVRTLSAEGVLSLLPDLLLAGAEAGPPNVLAQIAAAGVAVTRFMHGYTTDLVLASILRVAQALRMPSEGKRVATQFAHDWQGVRADVSQRYGAALRPRVLFILGHTGNQMMVAGQDTAADAMLGFAGADNALRGFTGYRPLTAEGAIAARPDVVLTTHTGTGTTDAAAKLLAQPGLANTPAGRYRRIVLFDALYLLGFGPRLPQAVAELARKVHAA